MAKNTSNFLHLACHGLQDKTDPTKSAFALYDGKLHLSEIAKLSVTGSELAFLSACQTATGDEQLSEEAVHLAAGMLTIGHKAVIGSMWSIGDTDAANVTGTVYAQIKEQNKGQIGGKLKIAYALHEAVKILRSEDKQDIPRWAPFVHFGL